VLLPGGARCPSDSTRSPWYTANSYLVPKGTDPASIDFKKILPAPGLFLVAFGGPWEAQSVERDTALVQVPEYFNVQRFQPSDVLPGGATTATWEAGIACADDRGVASTYWNVELTFKYQFVRPRWVRVEGRPHQDGVEDLAVAGGRRSGGGRRHRRTGHPQRGGPPEEPRTPGAAGRRRTPLTPEDNERCPVAKGFRVMSGTDRARPPRWRDRPRARAMYASAAVVLMMGVALVGWASLSSDAATVNGAASFTMASSSGGTAPLTGTNLPANTVFNLSLPAGAICSLPGRAVSSTRPSSSRPPPTSRP